MLFKELQSESGMGLLDVKVGGSAEEVDVVAFSDGGAVTLTSYGQN